MDGVGTAGTTVTHTHEVFCAHYVLCRGVTWQFKLDARRLMRMQQVTAPAIFQVGVEVTTECVV
jgi:hypothetical protein